jgi:putative lipoprotein (rSAM/lipoprotein system)
MKKIEQIGRKILRKIYTGLGLTTVALVFQACYGTPPVVKPDVLIQGTVKSQLTNAPIKGIKVSIKDGYQHQLTDSTGQFQMYVPQEHSYTIQFDDIDGEANGLYQSTEKSVGFSENKIDMKDIYLDAE